MPFSVIVPLEADFMGMEFLNNGDMHSKPPKDQRGQPFFAARQAQNRELIDQ
jgi:hypothetical protein